MILDLAPIKPAPADPARREHFMVRHGVDLRWKAGRFEETILVPGDVVSVVGCVMLDPPLHELGFREPAPAEVRLSGSDRQPIAIGSPVERPRR